jgi:2-amino-4-hydroxy-6-hydroxymethyldihydropteridine diphosphokinase
MVDRPLDRIHIKELLLRCIIGINPEERDKEQDVILDITLYADLREAGRTDDIVRTIDYKKLKLELVDFVEHSRYGLIEALADAVARICLAKPRVEKVLVRVDKPGALRFAKSVAVEIERCTGDCESLYGDGMEITAYIAIGSNIEPERNVESALRAMCERLTVDAVSTFYRTPALGRPGQPDYLNGAVRVRTQLDPVRLKFEVLRAIESELGRQRSDDPYAERAIDLDLVSYGDVVMSDPEIVLPDPDVRSRSFVAVPLVELDPDIRLSDTGECLRDLPIAQDLRDMHPEMEFTRRLRELLP